MPFYFFPIAQGAPGNSMGGSMMQILFMFGMFGLIWWFLVLGPESRKRKQHQAMLDALKKGDRVITAGGIHGTVVNAKDTIVVLKIAENTKIEINRSAISTVVEAGAVTTEKSDKSDKTE